MDDTIQMIRTQVKADNMILVTGMDFNYDYFGDGTTKTGGPIVRHELVPWGPAGPRAVKNVAYSFHPYQHGACCGDITNEAGDKDLSITDPYQSAYCMYGTGARLAASNPAPGRSTLARSPAVLLRRSACSGPNQTPRSRSTTTTGRPPALTSRCGRGPPRAVRCHP